MGAGTPEYGAPEVMEEGKRGGPAADVWAVGMMLLRACMGSNNQHMSVLLMPGKVRIYQYFYLLCFVCVVCVNQKINLAAYLFYLTIIKQKPPLYPFCVSLDTSRHLLYVNASPYQLLTRMFLTGWH